MLHTDKNSYIDQEQAAMHMSLKKVASAYEFKKHMERVNRELAYETIGQVLAMAACLSVLIYCFIV